MWYWKRSTLFLLSSHWVHLPLSSACRAERLRERCESSCIKGGGEILLFFHIDILSTINFINKKDWSNNFVPWIYFHLFHCESCFLYKYMQSIQSQISLYILVKYVLYVHYTPWYRLFVRVTWEDLRLIHTYALLEFLPENASMFSSMLKQIV